MHGRVFLMVGPTINVLSKNKKNIKKIHLKMNIFTALKYCCILHGRVFLFGRFFFLPCLNEVFDVFGNIQYLKDKLSHKVENSCVAKTC